MGCGASSTKQASKPTKDDPALLEVKHVEDKTKGEQDKERPIYSTPDNVPESRRERHESMATSSCNSQANSASSRIGSASKEPAALHGVRFERVGKKSAVIAWDQPSMTADRADEFRVNFTGTKDEDPTTMHSLEWSGTECRCIMYGLKKAYAYSIVIRGVRGLHAGPWTQLVLPPRLDLLTEDEASARISAGMKGMHTRKQLKAGNVSRFEDPDASSKKEAARLSKKRRQPKRLRMAGDLDDDEAATMIQAQMRRILGTRMAKTRKKELMQYKSCARRATRDICNGVIFNMFKIPDLFVSVELGTSELNGVCNLVVTKLLRNVAREMGRQFKEAMAPSEPGVDHLVESAIEEADDEAASTEDTPEEGGEIAAA
jgi:hypothetical protein